MAAIPIPGVNTPTYQSWGAAVAGKLNAIGWAKVTVSTDTWGNAVVTAAALGLATVTGGVASIYTPVYNASGGTYGIGEVIGTGSVLSIRVFQINAPGSVATANSQSVSLNVIGFGTMPAADPSDDESDTLNPLEEEDDDE